MLKDKIKALMLNENEKSSKKKIENIVVFIIILIITVIAINSIWGGDKKQENKSQDINQDITKQLASVEETSVTSNEEETLEKRLESILSNIDGVGKVKVLITYSESSEVVAMYNENNKNSVIEEKDSGRRNTYYYTNRYCKRYYIQRRKWRKSASNAEKL